jgi:signal transduction histidine kinase
MHKSQIRKSKFFQVGLSKYWHNNQFNGLKMPVLLAITVISTAIIGVSSYQLARELIISQIKAKALLQVSQATDEINRWLEMHANEVKLLAITDNIRSLNWQVALPLIRQEIKRVKNFFVFGIIFPDGSYYYTKHVGKPHANVGDREYFRKAIAGQFNISDPIIGRTSKVPVIVIAVPIHQNYQSNSPVIGVLFGEPSIKKVAEVTNQVHYGKNSYAFILNSQGKAVIHPNPSLMSTSEKPAPSFLQSTNGDLAVLAKKMVNRNQGLELINIDGERKYVAYLPLEQVNWSLALVIPRTNIESPLTPLNILASILGLLLLLIAIIFWRQIRLSEATKKQACKLEETLKELRKTQTHIIQQEKMSSLGQLVAGIAHEINNPIGFIYSNIGYFDQYSQDLFRIIQLYEHYYPDKIPDLQNELAIIELDFLREDLPKLLSSMKSGAERIKEIVISLRNFSRLDEATMKEVDIHHGIDSTLLILEVRLKNTNNLPAIEVVKEYGNLPLVECYPGQMNQVFINILSNAIDALEGLFIEDNSLNSGKQVEITQPQIRIKTELDDCQRVNIHITNNGPDIPQEIQSVIFDPFFTTKSLGKGSGLGLSISYQIITQVHRGNLLLFSTPNQPTEFVIQIPLHQRNLVGEQRVALTP